MGVNLVGVVHEQKGAKKFQPYLNASIYFDEEVRASSYFFFPKRSFSHHVQYYLVILATDRISFETEENLTEVVYYMCV